MMRLEPKMTVALLKKKNIKVYFVLIPLSPLVFEEKNKHYRERILAVEAKIREIAQKNNIKIVGSYKPWEHDMDSNSFLDAQHPKPSALGRFKFE